MERSALSRGVVTHLPQNSNPETDQAGDGRSKPHPTILRWLAVALVATAVAGTIVSVYKTDIHLTLRTQAAAEIGGPRLRAHVDGRDAYLTGEGTIGDLDHAMTLADGIPGLRVLRSEVEIVAARTDLAIDPTEADPSVTAVVSAGQITLRGLIPDDGSRDLIVAAAEAAVGAERVRDRLRETRTVKSASWLADVPPAIAAAAPFAGVTLSFGGGNAAVTGAVSTSGERDTLLTALVDAGVEVRSGSLSVTEPLQPWIAIDADGQGVTMKGRIGRTQLAVVLAALNEAYGAAATTRQATELAANSAEVAWPEIVSRLIPSTIALDSWSIRAGVEGVTLFGVASDPFLARRVTAVAERWQRAGVPIDLDIQLTPAAVVMEMNTVVGGVALFGEDAALTTEGMTVLDEVAALLFVHRDIVIASEVWVRATGDIPHDRVASDEAAALVRSYVVSRGIDPLRVVAQGRGPDLAASDPATGADARLMFTVTSSPGTSSSGTSSPGTS